MGLLQGLVGKHLVSAGAPAASEGKETLSISLPRGDAESASQATSQVLKVVTVLQGRLQDSEGVIGDLQANSDELKKRHRVWVRRVQHLEREAAAATQRADEADASAKRARVDALPAVDTYKEAEVLRSRIQVAADELARLRDELNACRDELAHGWPRVAESEDADIECAEAASNLEAAHAEEIATLRSSHLEDVSVTRSRHASRMAEMEAVRHEEVTNVRVGNAEELGSLKVALEGAKWQADVYVREQQDAIREVCIQQRENARLAKQHGEARQKLLELAVRMEALRAEEAGAPAREAELQALRQRYLILQQTASEWREALERKRADCKVWRRRAVQPGPEMPDEDDGEDQESTYAGSSVGVDAASAGTVFGAMIKPPPSPVIRLGRVASAPTIGPWSGIPTPTRPSRVALPPSLSPPRGARNTGTSLLRMGMHMPAVPSPAPIVGAGARHSAAGATQKLEVPQFPAEELLTAASRLARLQADLACAQTHPLSLCPDFAAGNRSANTSVFSWHSDLGGVPQTGFKPDLESAIQDAENEVEMLTFLLGDSDAEEAEVLLEMEARRQPSPIAKKLRAQLQELVTRGGRKQ